MKNAAATEPIQNTANTAHPGMGIRALLEGSGGVSVAVNDLTCGSPPGVSSTTYNVPGT
jgi:hypothetical protein